MTDIKLYGFKTFVLTLIYIVFAVKRNIGILFGDVDGWCAYLRYKTRTILYFSH